MRLSPVLVAAALVLNVVACSSATTGTGTGTGGGTSGTGAAGGATGAPTCDSACAYYLQCKGTDGAETRAQCNQQCAAQNNSAQQLTDFQKLDCPAAIAYVENPSTSSSSSSSSSSSGGADCNGCVWDGSSCIYLTGSNGNYFDCARSCCP